MSLSGQFAANYDIWYRVCDSGNGWTGWTSNGQACGVSGGSSGLCGIDVVLVRKGQPAPGPTSNAFIETSGIGLVSQAHVASAGWLAPVGNGETAGQTGMSRSLQALYVSTQGIDASVEVSAHVANIGWQPYVSGASYAGTVGKGLAIQAVKLRLTGNDASKYDIYYRVHAADYGWLGWAKNDAAAGTVGLSKQAEAIQIKLVAKGSSEAPVQDHAALIQLPGLSAKANCSGLGWQASVGNGGVAGTVGQNRAMEAMQLSLSDSSMSGGISYSAHVSNIGWQSAVSDGATSGTVGQGQQIQAVKINLTGDVSNYFDVWYRVHVSNYGWLGWTKNGSPAGTTKLGIPVQALQVKIAPRALPHQALRLIRILRPIVIWGIRPRDHIQKLVVIAYSFLHIAPVTLRMSRLLEFLTTLHDRIASTHSSSVLVNISVLVISSRGLLGQGMQLIARAWCCNVCMRLAWIWVGITPITIVGCPSRPITP